MGWCSSWSDDFDDADYSDWTVTTFGGASGVVAEAGTVLYPTSYGTGAAYHGPQISQAKVISGDFKIDWKFDFTTSVAALGGTRHGIVFDGGLVVDWYMVDSSAGIARYVEVAYYNAGAVYDSGHIADTGDFVGRVHTVERVGTIMKYYVDDVLKATVNPCTAADVASINTNFVVYTTYTALPTVNIDLIEVFEPMTLEVSAPNGGEYLIQGASYEITWVTDVAVSNVHIEFSDDNGLNYSDVVVSTADDGSYFWTVPAVVASDCLIKISSVLIPAIFDVSDAVFTITAPASQDTKGGSLIQSWLAPVQNFFERGKGIIEQSNQMILSYVPSEHKQITGDFLATVVKVHDGDTVTLRTAFRDFDFPLRVANINAPEMNAGGEHARDWLSERVLGKEVLVVINKDNRVGKYGRLIGEIFANGLNLGEEMMRLMLVVPFGSIKHRIEPFSKILKRAGY